MQALYNPKHCILFQITSVITHNQLSVLKCIIFVIPNCFHIEMSKNNQTFVVHCVVLGTYIIQNIFNNNNALQFL